MKRILSFLLLISVLCATAQPGDVKSYYYHGRKATYPVSNSRIVIGLASGETVPGRVRNLSDLLGLPDSALAVLPGNRMVTAHFPPGSTAMRQASASLKQAGFVSFIHPCFTSAYGKDMAYGDAFVVKLKAASSLKAFTALLQKYGCSIKRPYAYAKNIYVLTAGAASQYDGLVAANLFFESGLFEYAEPDLTLLDGLFVADPNDPLYSYQWEHNNTGSAIQYSGTPGADLKVQQAWTISTGAGIKVAVIDEGVDISHADLSANMLQGFDCLSGTANPGDGQPLGPARAHGTNCTGIIAAVANNNIGIAGIAPDSKIIPINLAAANGYFTDESNIAAGFDYAWQHGADVISNSWGGGTPSNIIDDAINRAVTFGRGGKGSVVLFASGNNNTGIGYPASNSQVISVGGVNMCGQRKSPASVSCDGETWGASYGTGLDVVAPCVKIVSTDLSGSAGYNTAGGAAGDYYFKFNGTSSATPAASAVVALVLAANPGLTVSDVRSILENTCDKLPGYTYSSVSDQPNGTWNSETGHGRVNAFNAVQVALSGVFCQVRVKAQGATRICPGGSVTLSVVNPVAGTMYQWRKDSSSLTSGTNISATVTGNYDVVATAANGCIAYSAPVAVTVLANTPPLRADAGIDTFVCAGTPVRLGGTPVASGGAPFLPAKRFFGMDWLSNSFVRFSETDPLHYDTIAKQVVTDAQYNAGQFFGGGDFTPYGYYGITQEDNRLLRVDTGNGQSYLIGVAPAPAGYTWSGMAWDPAGKNLYGLASGLSSSSLCLIDPFTAAVSPVATVPVGATEWLAINNSGQLYAMSDDNYVYRINKITGDAVRLPNPVGADVIYQQDADFDPLTNQLYLTTLIQSQNYASDLRTVDTATGKSVLIGSLGGLSEIDATAIAGPGYLYNWSPATGLSDAGVAVPVAMPGSTTTYKLTVTDACGNSATSSVTVKVSTPAAAFIGAAKDSIGVAETLLLHTAGKPGYTYQWFNNGRAISGATDSGFLASYGGSYTVHVINGACDSLSAPFLVKTNALLLNNNNAETLCDTYFYDSGGALQDYGVGEAYTKTIRPSTPGTLPRFTLLAFGSETGQDVLNIYDGSDTLAPLLASLGGNPAIPAQYTGTSGYLTFRFRSNGSVNGPGWAGAVACYQPTVYRSRNTGDAADSSTWEIKSGTTFSPAQGYPHWYDDSIIISSGHTVTVHNNLVWDQVQVRPDGTLAIDTTFTLRDGPGADLACDGTLAVTGAGNISGSGTLELGGDADNSTASAGSIRVNTLVNGNRPQTISAKGSFSNLTINNPAVAIKLFGNMATDTLLVNNGTGNISVSSTGPDVQLIVAKQLSLQRGHLLMGEHTACLLPAGSALSGGSDTGFISGLVLRGSTLTRDSLFFPLGDSIYRPVNLRVSHATPGTFIYQVNVVPGNAALRDLPATIDAVSPVRHYVVSGGGSATTDSAIIQLSYGAGDGVTDTAALRIAGAAGTQWQDLGGSGLGSPGGTISSPVNLSAINDLVMGNAAGGTNAFAVRFVSVSVALDGKQADLVWVVANESAITGYTVEVSSDGLSFLPLGTVPAAPGSAALKQYALTDRLPSAGINYYRVRMTDNRGVNKFSKTVSITLAAGRDFVVWPNPASRVVTIQDREIMDAVRIYNGNGQLLVDVRPGTRQVTLPVGSWAAGFYEISITAGGKTVHTKIIRQ